LEYIEPAELELFFVYADIIDPNLNLNENDPGTASPQFL
jgi:hypothetical protein